MTSMKTLINTLVICISILSKLSGQGFNIDYGLSNSKAEYCVGKAFEYKDHYVSIIATTKILPNANYSIIELDKYGDHIKSYMIQDSTIEYFVLDWIKTIEGDFYIISKEEKSSDIFSLYLIKLNSNLVLESK